MFSLTQRLLEWALLVVLFAAAANCQTVSEHPLYTWTAGSFSDSDPTNDNWSWDNPANWISEGQPGVPPTNAIVEISRRYDQVIATGLHRVFGLTLGSNSVLRFDRLEVEQLLLSGGGLSGGSVSVTGPSEWRSGSLSGYLSVSPSGDFRVTSTNSHQISASCIVSNSSRVLFQGPGSELTFSYGTPLKWYNLPGAVLDFDHDGSIFGGGSIYAEVHNPAGAVIRKSAGTNTLFFNASRTENAGTIDAAAGALEIAGTAQFNDGSVLTGAGEVRLSQYIGIAGTLIVSNTLAAFTSPPWYSIDCTNVTFVTVGHSLLDWREGAFWGDITIPEGTHLRVSGAGAKNIVGTIRNSGWWDIQSATSIEGGTVSGTNLAVFNNLPAGVVNVLSNGFVSSLGNQMRFTNSGLLTFTTASAIDGSLYLRPEGLMRVFIGGAAPASYGSLTGGRFGYVKFGGTLDIVFTNNFVPSNGTGFTLVTQSYGDAMPAFDAVALPVLPFHSYWRTNASIAPAFPFRSTFGLALEGPRVITPAMSANHNFQLTFHDSPGSSCVVEVSEDLKTWVPTSTNSPFDGTVLFQDPETASHEKRFYRILVKP
jgi:hypothetical protein